MAFVFSFVVMKFREHLPEEVDLIMNTLGNPEVQAFNQKAV